MQIRCPHCGTPTDIGDRDLTLQQTCPSCGSHFSLVDAAAAPTVAAPNDRQQVGHFELLDQIGVGAFGSVWKARDVKLDRLVAVKIPRSVQPGTAQPEEFLREARAAAGLRHPNIVSIHDVGRDNGTAYIVSDLISGVSLSDWLSGQQPNARQAAELCAKLADALHYAHEQGVVHRDVKPANVMIDVEGQPHVMDFGLAKQDAAEVTITLDGRVLGTPAYMSPEQAQGLGHQADRRSDVYSLGVILFQLLTGGLPFRGTARMLLHQVLHEEPKSPRALNDRVPRDLETICLKCLEKDRDRRYQTAADLRDDLRRYLAGEPILARPVGRVGRIWRWSRRKPAAATALVLLVVMIVGATTTIGVITGILGARRNAERERVVAQVDALLKARPAEVPQVLEKLEAAQDVAVPRLLSLMDQTPASRQWRLRLGLLPSDPTQVDPLSTAMLTADIEELTVIQHALPPQEINLEPFREILDRADNATRERFNAACVLAALQAEGQTAAATEWSGHAPFITQTMITQLLQNPSRYPLLLETLRPIGRHLHEPLCTVFRDNPGSESQRYATALLADYASKEPRILAELIGDTDEEQFELLCAPLETLGEDAIPSLREVLQQAVQQEAELAPRIAAARRAANVAVALLRIGHGESVWPLLKNSRDPTCRTFLINRIANRGVDPSFIWKRFLSETDASIRCALLLTLGALDEGRLSGEQRQPLVAPLVEVYRGDPDPGIHAAAEWVLRQWNEADGLRDIDGSLSAKSPTPESGWYVNSEGQTMMLVRDGSSARITPGYRPKYRVGRSFWIGSKLVTVAEYRRFNESHPIEAELAPSPDCPVHGASWLQAAAYCNWLSQQDGIPEDQWCFLPNAEGKYAAGMRLAEDYVDRDGYRLPTDHEWDYAYRAGATTQFSFGDASETLGGYAWNIWNSQMRTWPVGALRPNDFGLFDMHGSLWEWTASIRLGSQSRLLREVAADHEPLVYGGTFRFGPDRLRPIDRRTGGLEPYDREQGFRVVRTAR